MSDEPNGRILLSEQKRLELSAEGCPLKPVHSLMPREPIYKDS